MKRDLNLVREILLWATEQVNAGFSENPTLQGYTDEQIGYHVHIMEQAGLVAATDSTMLDGPGPSAILRSLTWEGHDFIDAARDDTVWGKVKSKILTSGASFSFGLLKEALVLAAKWKLEMP